MGEDKDRFSAKISCGGSDNDSVAFSDTDHEKRYAELFRQLDLNKDGKVDISELRTALAARGLHQGTAEEVSQRDAAGARMQNVLFINELPFVGTWKFWLVMEK